MNSHAKSLEAVLGLTAFTAGAVDVISFTKLGGVFASAMTGNLAFLGLYLAKMSFGAAFGSFIALAGFVAGGAAGHFLVRGRMQHAALQLLLGVECGLLVVAALLWLGGGARDLLIALFSVAMGLQSIVGKRVNLSNIPTVVFTSTLTNIVIAVTDMVATGVRNLPKDTRRQLISFFAYFGGALVAGVAVAVQAADAAFVLPVVGVVVALVLLKPHAG
jgi:uncharacterized membrane protein YoaK (UPF0700 family)